MFDGKALAVSEARGVGVKVSVGVTDRVGVRVGTRSVFVGRDVPTVVAGTGVDVRVQANELTIKTISKKCFCFIT